MTSDPRTDMHGASTTMLNRAKRVCFWPPLRQVQKGDEEEESEKEGTCNAMQKRNENVVRLA